MKVRGLICAVGILCCATAAAFADGAVFAQVQGMAKVRMPDQSALITFDGKTEQLVIETDAEGEGTEFAWVVPVPSMPKVEAATPGLFPTLRMITRPRVVEYNTGWLFLSAVGLVFGILMWMSIYTREWTKWLVVFLVLLLLRGMFLSAGGSTMTLMPSGISVLERKIVGLYETVTISGADGKNIADWLNSNGFKVSGSIQDALTQYAKEGWIFVAGRLRRDSAEAERFIPHPLSFSFATSRAVYPMRLTGIENGPVAVDLYVAGNEEAVAGPFVRQRGGRLDFAASRDRDDFIPMSHDALQSYCKGFSALTLLSATLSPDQMKADLYLTWKPLTPFRHIYHMREGALALASLLAAGIFLVLSIVCAVQYRRRYEGGPAALKRLLAAAGVLLGVIGAIAGLTLLTFCEFLYGGPILICSLAVLAFTWRRAVDYDRHWFNVELTKATPPPPPLRVIMTVVLAPILLGSCVYLALPKLRGADVLSLHLMPLSFNKLDHELILKELDEMEPADDPAAALAACRKEATAIIAKARGEHAKAYGNPFTGQPIHEEDSPGNYLIELKGDKPKYFYFDINGRKIELGVIGAKREEGSRQRVSLNHQGAKNSGKEEISLFRSSLHGNLVVRTE
jgi:hypothetical protein